MTPMHRLIRRPSALVLIMGFLTCFSFLPIRGSAQNLSPQEQPPAEASQIEGRGLPGPAIALLPDVKPSIDQEWLDVLHARYKAEVRIMNKGNVPMPPVQVQTLGMRYNPVSTPPNPSLCIANRNCTIKDHRTIGSLAPGQDKKYKVDPKFTAAETVIVEVTIFCNPPNNCAELSVTNNKTQKVLGPH